MRIQHNIMAMSAYRNYTNNVSAMKKNLEKLSSGYKINRAGDDAAGLAISEKMRAQITGLETAQKNAKDGISLVQTAEGALTEVHDMLNRMVELASMSANGTYDNTTDRAQLQKEIDQLTSEIDRIADSSNFNGIKLLDGSMDAGGDTVVTEGVFQLAANHDGTVDSGAITLPAVKDAATAVLGTDTILHKDATTGSTKNEFSVELHNLEFSNATGSSVTLKIGSSEFTLKAGAAAGAGTKMDAAAIATAFKENKFVVGDKDSTTAMTGSKATVEGTEYDVTVKDGKITFSTTADLAAGKSIPQNVTVTGAGGAAQAAQPATAAKGDLTVTWDATPTWAENDTVTIAATGGDITFTATATKTAAGWDVTGAPTGFNATFDGSKLSLEATATGKKTDIDLGTITATIGTYDAGGTKPNGTVAGALTDGTDGAAAVPAGADPVTGRYNASTTNIMTKGAAAGEDLASTVFQLDSLADNGKISEGTTLTIGTETYTFTKDTSKASEKGYVVFSDTDTMTQIAAKLTDAADGNKTYTVGHDGTDITVTEVKGQKNFDLTTMDGIEKSLGFAKATTSAKDDTKGLTLQIGDTAESFNQLKVSIKDMHAKSLGIDKGSIKISDQASAAKAIDKIKNAINTVSDVRGTLGATQNRLDHTINNLGVMTENIQDAESTIRDVDVAEEMMAYTKNNILIQSAQAMLAQANQVPQGVLQLLQ